jgi:hypothetical protein
MVKNPGVIKIVLSLYKQGCSIISIAKTLNLHIEEVVNIINGYN